MKLNEDKLMKLETRFLYEKLNDE